MPSVLTSDKWIALAEEKEKEKSDALIKKEERKRKREEKATEVKNKNTKQHKEANKTDKKDKKEKINDNEEINEHEKINEDRRETEEVKHPSKEALIPNSFVVVVYENAFYPGQIMKKVGKDSYLISTMMKSGVQDWKWPEEKDQLSYSLEDIKEVIKPPIKKNSRGAFLVPEMAKYEDFKMF